MTAREKYLRWAESTVGIVEGQGAERKWAAAAGISYSTAWCAAYISYGLTKLGLQPPISPAYTGSWLTWKGGERVPGGMKNAEPGDLLVIDWGDGGRTDHIGIYVGNGQYIAGNNSENKVGKSSVPTGNVVGVVRPKAFKSDADVDENSRGGFDIPGLGGIEDALPGGDFTLLDVFDEPGEIAGDVAGDVIKGLGDLLGANGGKIMLNIAFVGGGALLVYYGVAKAAGVDAPVRSVGMAAATKGMAS